MSVKCHVTKIAVTPLPPVITLHPPRHLPLFESFSRPAAPCWPEYCYEFNFPNWTWKPLKLSRTLSPAILDIDPTQIPRFNITGLHVILSDSNPNEPTNKNIFLAHSQMFRLALVRIRFLLAHFHFGNIVLLCFPACSSVHAVACESTRCCVYHDDW